MGGQGGPSEKRFMKYCGVGGAGVSPSSLPVLLRASSTASTTTAAARHTSSTAVKSQGQARRRGPSRRRYSSMCFTSGQNQFRSMAQHYPMVIGADLPAHGKADLIAPATGMVRHFFFLGACVNQRLVAERATVSGVWPFALFTMAQFS